MLTIKTFNSFNLKIEMMKLQNQLKQILLKANRPHDYTNRSFYCKGVNSALATGLVKIKVAEEGMIWTTDKNIKFNLAVSAGGYIRKKYIKGIITPGQILREIGALLLDENVKKVISSYSHLRSTKCPKCEGAGIIERFHYYCSGICFSCGGSGLNHTNDRTEVEIYKP
jgi:hypothetical protein